MVMKTLLPLGQNTLKFLIKSRRQAFLYPACVKSQLTGHIALLDLLKDPINIPSESVRTLEKKKIHFFFLVNSQVNHLGELQILAA